MNIVNGLVQGSPDWHTHRASHLNASDLPVAMGLSSYKKRDELLRECKTGVVPEVDDATQKRFNDGHRTEAFARAIIEEEQGEGLYPVTATLEIGGLNLSASFDGINMAETFCFEHKLINTKLAALTSIDDLDGQYGVQMTQQMMISGCKKCLFVASDGTKENMVQFWYEYDASLAKEIIAQWKQFQIDLETYEAPEIVVEPVANAIEALPTLNIQITGGVTKTNMDDYKSFALTFIENIKTDLKTDDDFANADALVKFCGYAEKELEAVKKAALSQTADIADLFATIDTLKAEMRTRRLMLDKLVKSRKQMIKEEVVQGANATFARHIGNLESRLSHVVRMPEVPVNFIDVIKNKRTVESLRNAVNSELARVKIAANELADRIDANIKAMLEHAPEHRFLFTDLQQTCAKETDDFVAMVKLRVSAYKEQEECKLEAERERIRQEEEVKAKAEADRIADERERASQEEERLKADEAARIERERVQAESDAKTKAEAVEATEQLKSEPEQAKQASGSVVSMPLKTRPAEKPSKTLSDQLAEDIARWCDAWRIPVEASAELCEIIESHIPESFERKA